MPGLRSWGTLALSMACGTSRQCVTSGVRPTVSGRHTPNSEHTGTESLCQNGSEYSTGPIAGSTVFTLNRYLSFPVDSEGRSQIAHHRELVWSGLTTTVTKLRPSSDSVTPPMTSGCHVLSSPSTWIETDGVSLASAGDDAEKAGTPSLQQ